MEHQNKTKNTSLILNERSKFPLHQPTWKGIQLPRNWFTNREGEHSLYKGQAKAVKNSKVKLTNDPKSIHIPHEILLLNSLGLIRSNLPPWDSSNSSYFFSNSHDTCLPLHAPILSLI